MAFFRTFVCALFLLLTFNLGAQHFNRYCNSVVPFCLDVPGNFARAGNSPTGDGHLFTAKDGSSLSIYASYNPNNDTAEQRFNREQSALAADTTIANFTQMPVSGQVQNQENSFTLSYQQGGFNYLLFRKAEAEHWIQVELKYPVASSREYEDKAKRMLESLR